MKYTNKTKLPDYVRLWLESDEYDYDDKSVSASQLLMPLRQFALYRIYKDQISVDVTERIALRYGTAIHDSFEKVDIPNSLQEKRMQTMIKGFKLRGKPDLIIDLDQFLHTIVDLKSTSVWTYIYGSRLEDYKQQVSIYRFLAIRNGYNVSQTAEICMVFTDWSKSRAKKSEDYPQSRIKIVPIELMSIEETETFIVQRLTEIEKVLKIAKVNNQLMDVSLQMKLPECTDDDLWIDKQGRANRCYYCYARKFCSQYKDLKKQDKVNE